MSYRLLCFAVLFMLLDDLKALAQGYSISGKVVNSKSEALATANIILLNAKDSTLVKSDVTDETGEYKLEKIAAGAYLLKVNMLGYTTYNSALLELKDRDIVLGSVTLQPKDNKLKEVTVRGQKPLVEIHADKLVVNVENSIVNAGSSALEILARSPGVNVDQNDNISIKGKQGVNVMIDGKNMVVSGTDLANMLKAMPSSTISQIEIISNPGARYDAAGTAGIINIRTKHDQRMGVNGSVNGSYGQGVYSKYNAGFNLNYRNKKISSYISYNYGNRGWFNHLMLNRRFYNENSDAVLFSYVQDNFLKMPVINHNATFGMDYSISEKTTVGIAGTAASTRINQISVNASKALDSDGGLIYNFNTDGHHRQDYYNYTGNVNLRHRFNDQGKDLSVDVDYARYWNQSNQNFETRYTRADGSQYQPTYFMHSDLEGLTQIRALKADYTHPLKDKAKFETGIKTTYVTADNEPLFFQKTTGDFVLDTKRSNHFIYRENINAGYVNYNKEWAKWSTQLGFRVENTNVEADQVTLDSLYKTNYTQLFPSMAIQRNLGEKHDLGITLSRRIERPNYQQLNPFKFFIDNTTYRAGYPYLRPALTYAAELSHTFKKKFITTLSYSITSNNITQVIQPSETEDSVTVQTDKNLASVHNYSISLAYPFQFTKWWSSVNNITGWYAHYEGYLANTNLSNGSPGYSIYSSNNFMLPKGFGAELSFWYQSRQVYGFFDLKQMWTLGLGAQKSIMKQKGTLRLNAQDIFWRGLPSAVSTYNSYQEDFTVKRETRQVTLSFSYRFGNRKVAPAPRRGSAADEEKNRVGNAG